MGIEIRNAAPEELQAAIDVISTAFLGRPDTGAVAESLTGIWEPARVWVAYDEGTACGTLRSWGTHLTVPGGATLPGAAVAAVTVLPTHRRRGILTAMAAKEHASLVERGEAVGLLYASEATIYGRYGYAPGTRNEDWAVNPRVSRVHGEPVGTVELMAPTAAARDLIRGVHDAWRLRQAGEIRRRDIAWDLGLGLADEVWGERWKGWLIVHRDPSGIADGYARYTADPKWEGRIPQGVLKVNELCALTDGAYADLVRFLLAVDLVGTVRLEGRRPGESLPWLLANIRAARLVDAGDALWVRLFDVPRALEARTYEREASLVLEVVDDQARGGTSRLVLDAGPAGATCRPTDRGPDLTLPVAALSAAYLGGMRLRDVVLGTGVDEHRPGALGEADTLLRTADQPWCSTFF